MFSARDYCNRIRNSGAMLEISRELSILPKVIHTKFDESSTLCVPRASSLPPATKKLRIGRFGSGLARGDKRRKLAR